MLNMWIQHLGAAGKLNMLSTFRHILPTQHQHRQTRCPQMAVFSSWASKINISQGNHSKIWSAKRPIWGLCGHESSKRPHVCLMWANTLHFLHPRGHFVWQQHQHFNMLQHLGSFGRKTHFNMQPTFRVDPSNIQHQHLGKVNSTFYHAGPYLNP